MKTRPLTLGMLFPEEEKKGEEKENVHKRWGDRYLDERIQREKEANKLIQQIVSADPSKYFKIIYDAAKQKDDKTIENALYVVSVDVNYSGKTPISQLAEENDLGAVHFLQTHHKASPFSACFGFAKAGKTEEVARLIKEAPGPDKPEMMTVAAEGYASAGKVVEAKLILSKTTGNDYFRILEAVVRGLAYHGMPFSKLIKYLPKENQFIFLQAMAAGYAKGGFLKKALKILGWANNSIQKSKLFSSILTNLAVKGDLEAIQKLMQEHPQLVGDKKALKSLLLLALSASGHFCKIKDLEFDKAEINASFTNGCILGGYYLVLAIINMEIESGKRNIAAQGKLFGMRGDIALIDEFISPLIINPNFKNRHLSENAIGEFISPFIINRIFMSRHLSENAKACYFQNAVSALFSSGKISAGVDLLKNKTLHMSKPDFSEHAIEHLCAGNYEHIAKQFEDHLITSLSKKENEELKKNNTIEWEKALGYAKAQNMAAVKAILTPLPFPVNNLDPNYSRLMEIIIQSLTNGDISEGLNLLLSKESKEDKETYKLTDECKTSLLTNILWSFSKKAHVNIIETLHSHPRPFLEVIASVPKEMQKRIVDEIPDEKTRNWFLSKANKIYDLMHRGRKPELPFNAAYAMVQGELIAWLPKGGMNFKTTGRLPKVLLFEVASHLAPFEQNQMKQATEEIEANITARLPTPAVN